MCMMFESIVTFSQICKLESYESSVVFGGVEIAFAAGFLEVSFRERGYAGVRSILISEDWEKADQYLLVLLLSSFSS